MRRFHLCIVVAPISVICQPRTAAESKLERCARQLCITYTAVAPPLSSKERGLLDPKTKRQNLTRPQPVTAAKTPFPQRSSRRPPPRAHSHSAAKTGLNPASILVTTTTTPDHQSTLRALARPSARLATTRPRLSDHQGTPPLIAATKPAARLSPDQPASQPGPPHHPPSTASRERCWIFPQSEGLFPKTAAIFIRPSAPIRPAEFCLLVLVTDDSTLAAQRPSAPSLAPAQQNRKWTPTFRPAVPTRPPACPSQSHHHPQSRLAIHFLRHPRLHPFNTNNHRPIPNLLRSAAASNNNKLVTNVSCGTWTPTNGGDDKLPNLKRRRKEVALLPRLGHPHDSYPISHHNTASPIFAFEIDK